MGAFIARRLLAYVVIFLLITLGVFALVRAAPGDPVLMMISPQSVSSSTPGFLAHERHVLGLDQPLPVQYAHWLGRAVHGDLGYSYVNNEPVTTVLSERIGPTVELMGLGFLVSLIVGIPLGIVAATRRNKFTDYLITVFSLSVISIPSFFIGIVAIYIFALRLGVLPSAGMQTTGVNTFSDRIEHLVMPVLILGLAGCGPIVRYVRSGVVGELTEDYSRTAEAKGAGQARVVLRHAFRNSLIPLITFLTLNIPNLLAGAVVIEQVFAWPGMGQLTVSSVGQNDYPVIIGFALLVAILVLLCNLAADVLYAVADPRVKLR